MEGNTKVPIVGAIGHNKKSSLIPVYDFPEIRIGRKFSFAQNQFSLPPARDK